jgi:hypothetical protein
MRLRTALQWPKSLIFHVSNGSLTPPTKRRRACFDGQAAGAPQLFTELSTGFGLRTNVK